LHRRLEKRKEKNHNGSSRIDTEYEKIATMNEELEHGEKTFLSTHKTQMV
jgi:hypothetical protein